MTWEFGNKGWSGVGWGQNTTSSNTWGKNINIISTIKLWSSIYLYINKIVGIFGLWGSTPLRDLELGSWHINEFNRLRYGDHVDSRKFSKTGIVPGITGKNCSDGCHATFHRCSIQCSHTFSQYSSLLWLPFFSDIDLYNREGGGGSAKGDQGVCRV